MVEGDAALDDEEEDELLFEKIKINKRLSDIPDIPSEVMVRLFLRGKTIVIEHCKQDNSFKTKAQRVKKGLEDGVPGVNVLLNPEKPRKGCFEIREEGEGGEKFITLLDMARLFSEMKELDMEKVISDIIERIAGWGYGVIAGYNCFVSPECNFV